MNDGNGREERCYRLRPLGHGAHVIVRNVFSNWAWYALVLVSGFVIPRLIDGYQGREMLGLWDLGWSLTFYIGLLNVGIGSAVNRYVARYRSIEDWTALNATVSSSLALLSVGCMAGLVLAYVLANNISYFMGGQSDAVQTGRQLLVVLSLGAVVQLLGGVFNGVITGCERYDLLNVIRGSRDLVNLLVMLFLAINGFTIVAFGLTILVGQVMANLGKVVCAKRLCPHLEVSIKTVSRDNMVSMLGFGGKSCAHGIARIGLYQVNSILVAAFLGPVVLAVYARQRALVLHAVNIGKHYAQVFTPRSSMIDAQGDTEALRDLLKKASRYGLYITLPLFIVIMVMGSTVVTIWMGPDYVAFWVLMIIGGGHLFSISQSMSYSVLMGMGKHGVPGAIEVIGLLISLVLFWLFVIVNDYGLIGASLAMALPIALGGGIFTMIYACKQVRLKILEYCASVFVGPLLVCIPLVLCLTISQSTISEPVHSLIVGLITGGVATIGIYWKWVLSASLKNAIFSEVAVRFPFRRRKESLELISEDILGDRSSR